MTLLFTLSNTNPAETRGERTPHTRSLQQTNPTGCIKGAAHTRDSVPGEEDEVQSRKLSDMCVLGWGLAMD